MQYYKTKYNINKYYNTCKYCNIIYDKSQKHCCKCKIYYSIYKIHCCKHGNISVFHSNCICYRNINKINRIQNWYRFWKRQPVLWRIADYYTARKYAPENILKYVSLDK